MWTKKKIIYTAFEIVFAAVVPVVLIAVNYASWGEETIVFKVSIAGVMLLLLVAYIVKKVLIDKYLERLKAATAQHWADLKIETDPEKIARIKEELRKERTIESIAGFVIPAMLLVLLFALCKVLETAAVKLSGTVGLIGASEIVGAVFSVLAAREVGK